MSTLLHRYLGREAPLARLQETASRLERLQAVLSAVLPGQFAHACRVSRLDDEVLTIRTKGSAIAVRLKQLTPTLMTYFGGAGYPVRQVRIKVDLPEPLPEPQRTPVRTLTEKARENILALAQSLPEDAPLRASLTRLVERGHYDPKT